MRIYPAIDIKNGRAVRLYKGMAGEVTDYGVPAEAAKNWVTQGATYLHVVDLDGAFQGQGANMRAVNQILRLGVPVQLGGGIRSMADIEHRLGAGVARVILGTVALENPELVKEACATFPGRIVCGIDAKDGMVAVRGWVDASAVTPIMLAKRMRDVGVTTIVYTDISRDGTLEGPNVEATAALVRETGMEIIGSGGVGALKDVEAFKNAGCEGAIIGKALYAGAFTLKEALRFEEVAP